MSLTTEQKKGLHHCPGCGHLNQSHDGTGCVACDSYLDDRESCGRIPRLIETTYENVEALLAETVAAMRAELDAAEAEVKRLRDGIEALTAKWCGCWCPPQIAPDHDPRVQDCPRDGDGAAEHFSSIILSDLRSLLDGGA